MTTYFYLPEEKPLAVIKYKIFSIFSFHCLTVLALLVSSVNNIQHVNLCDQLRNHSQRVTKFQIDEIDLEGFNNMFFPVNNI